jgi:outer membrane protein assembly factor BamD
MRQLVIYFVLVIALFSGACSDFHKLQKSTDLNLKYEKAVEYYGKADYVKAQMLFDELYAVMRTGNKAEDITYYLAFCNYQQGDYILGGYMFRNFYRQFPFSARAEECLYMSAYCHYLNSPPYMLDQEDTYVAIEEFQFFVKQFPESKRIVECNKLIDKLREKLEQKAFTIARQYYRIADYKAAITSFELLLKDYPDTRYREEAHFLMLKSMYLLAENSVEAKREERYKDVLAQYTKFTQLFPESEYTGESKKIYQNTLDLQSKMLRDRKSKN